MVVEIVRFFFLLVFDSRKHERRNNNANWLIVVLVALSCSFQSAYCIERCNFYSLNPQLTNKRLFILTFFLIIKYVESSTRTDIRRGQKEHSKSRTTHREMVLSLTIHFYVSIDSWLDMTKKSC